MKKKSGEPILRVQNTRRCILNSKSFKVIWFEQHVTTYMLFKPDNDSTYVLLNNMVSYRYSSSGGGLIKVAPVAM